MAGRGVDGRDAPRWRRALGFLIAGALIAAAIAGLVWAFERYGWYAALIVFLSRSIIRR